MTQEQVQQEAYQINLIIELVDKAITKPESISPSTARSLVRVSLEASKKHLVSASPVMNCPSIIMNSPYSNKDH